MKSSGHKNVASPLALEVGNSPLVFTDKNGDQNKFENYIFLVMDKYDTYDLCEYICKL